MGFVLHLLGNDKLWSYFDLTSKMPLEEAKCQTEEFFTNQYSTAGGFATYCLCKEITEMPNLFRFFAKYKTFSAKIQAFH